MNTRKYTPEQLAERKAAYAKRYYAANRETRLASTRAWSKANPDKVRAHKAKARKGPGPFVPPPAGLTSDPKYPDFSWSSLGYCWSHSRIIEKSNGQKQRVGGYYLKHVKNYNGYYTVNLDQTTVLVAQRMMATFGPPKPTPRHQINHVDQNKQNNAISNLEYVTPKQNKQHSKTAKRRRRARLTQDDKFFIGMFYGAGMTKLELARLWDVSPLTIYRHLGFAWAQRKAA